ncbi:PQQ-binding-like beta-propeller repeat protein [Sphingomonas sp. LHG3406-1]|uniref:outer membrane protein assembly factor BamB family protein n=1 Tax=Sphingomonas sp. LHG3406-1 TaxID=2804617 RepID=UPI00262479D0|nr:PQQ-binding-like beta-propeller repeat protein [Sphingomonas sp. LHG3406-1]
MLSACGGGGGSDPNPPVQVTPPITTATLPVTLSAAAADVTIAEGESSDFGFTATYSGTSTQPIVADVTVGSDRYQLVGTPTASGSSFNVALRTAALAPGGKNSTSVTFRLCTSANCTTVYPGSTQTFTVNLDVQMKDWSTLQRDAGHTGYVAVNYNSSKFAEAWNVPTALSVKGVAARRGGIFYNTSLPNGRLVTRAINPATGAQLWETDLGAGSYFSPPSTANGRVISMGMDISSGAVPMSILRASDGGVQGALSYASQFSNGGSPTPFGDDLYFQAGYYGNEVYGANAAAGTQSWRTDATQAVRGYVQEGQSVAVDNSSVYFFGGGDLTILSRATGAITRRIPNPHFTMFGLSYFGVYYGGPLLDGNGRIVTFTDNKGPEQPLPLAAFQSTGTAPLWRSSASYVGDPALRDGKLYAARAGTAIVDILDMATGAVTGSINLGADKGGLSSNIVLTGSHMFVATDTATYAVDLKATTPAVVWTAPRGGRLAITPDNLLVVTTNNGLFAYRLA